MKRKFNTKFDKIILLQLNMTSQKFEPLALKKGCLKTFLDDKKLQPVSLLVNR